MTESEQQAPVEETANDETPKVEVLDRFIAHPEEDEQTSEHSVRVSVKKKSPVNLLLIALAVAAACAIAYFSLNKPKPKTDSDDLGAGVFSAAGLRGRLVTKWQGSAQYQLRIGPLDTWEDAGFARVAAHPPGPIVINIRVLDASGFALCGKQIVLPFDAGKTGGHGADVQGQQKQEQDRERGNDIFHDEFNSDGQIDAINAQGVLPCSADQYKHFDYWDFTTNFPTRAEQDQMVNHTKPAKDEEEEETPSEGHRTTARRVVKKAPPAFYIQGDDRVTGFDPSREILEAGAGHTFTILRKSDDVAAAGWAADSSLIHYKCDPHANCALMHAGSGSVIQARMNE